MVSKGRVYTAEEASARSVQLPGNMGHPHPKQLQPFSYLQVLPIIPQSLVP